MVEDGTWRVERDLVACRADRGPVIGAVVLGEGEHLFNGIHLPNLGFKPVQTTAGEEAMHVILKRHSG